MYKFKLDFEGWKEFRLNIESDLGANSAPDIRKIQRFYFTSTGWSSNSNTAEDGVCIDTIYAVNSEAAGTASKLCTREDEKKFSALTQNAAILFNRNKHVYQNGTVSLLDENDFNAKTVVYDGVPMVPAAFFEKYFGGTAAVSGNTAEISLNGKTVKASADNAEYTADGEAKSFSAAPRIYREIFFVPVTETANALGLNAETFGSLTVIAAADVIEKIKESDAYCAIAADRITNTFDANTVTDEDFDELRQRAKEFYVGDETIDLTNPYMKKMVSAVETSAKSSWKSMNKGDDIKILFGNKEPVLSEDMRLQYEYLEKMAKGWGTYGTEMYHDKELKKDILFGLEWLYNNLYGQAELDGEGWRSIWLFNWWDWCVGVPQSLVKTIAILGEELSREKADEYLRIAKKLVELKASAKTPARAG